LLIFRGIADFDGGSAVQGAVVEENQVLPAKMFFKEANFLGLGLLCLIL
jgi:hypothetical protein